MVILCHTCCASRRICRLVLNYNRILLICHLAGVYDFQESKTTYLILSFMTGTALDWMWFNQLILKYIHRMYRRYGMETKSSMRQHLLKSVFQVHRKLWCKDIFHRCDCPEVLWAINLAPDGIGFLYIRSQVRSMQNVVIIPPPGHDIFRKNWCFQGIKRNDSVY